MIIDLTMTLREGIMTFPVHWHPVVEITQLGRFEVEGRETRKIVLGTHTGTHVDAPRHFVPKGTTIENTDLDIYYGPARVLDFTHLPDKTEITREMLVEHIGRDFPSRIVFRYDWERRLDSLKYYTDHPYLSEEACEWIVENGIRLVGFDAPMPDDPRNGRGSDRDSPNHTILLGAGVAILEYLVNLSQIPTKDFILSALPLKIEEGDGAPVRAVAIVE
ncbi:cyclase family protein [Rhizobium leguminosarum]|uniref:cyclase family protein n=3 Tax=Rhizobium leguminosarum TaxID=384 RepID=UPI000FEC2D42|nr:cyclase family protein [Rhizobium leguminosarum]MBB4387243.1 kynurenine formamidase [Rhizobium leguminosarum]MBB4587545.1 kynurenine formamidase [Rhizobium leguminosarum]RWX36482.1 cyclase family protein [Rhizobium leguminosarum]